MVAAGRKEIDFEAAIERDMLDASGYLKGDPSDFDAQLALVPKELFAFLEASQPTLWEQLKKDHPTGLEVGVLDALTKSLDHRGTLDVLRHGFKFFGKRLSAAFFRPAHRLNPDLEAQYAANRLVVTRQVKFDPNGESSVDMMVSLNGLPVATMELKNAMTGQTVEHAKKQYKFDRDPKLPLFQFKRRALVHFAVDTDEVYMTTRLSGRSTRFLPFNRGCEGGAGNPTIEEESYKTSYLWSDVLERHSLLDILARFMHLVIEEEIIDGKTRKTEKMIFPRFHQLDVVRRLEAAAKAEGPGHHYLVQHSAGSGKSNSIAWTAHRLASLHTDKDEKIFDSVIVVTDRRILDEQLQDTIYQFEHKEGVVAKIDDRASSKSRLLQEHLLAGTPIVIVTIQTFPFVSELVGKLPGRNYAVIVDEAHSSQNESASSLRGVLTGPATPSPKANEVRDSEAAYDRIPGEDDQEPEEPTYEDEIARVMESRGQQANLSFFAFTATPKAKTLEVFGRPGPEGVDHFGDPQDHDWKHVGFSQNFYPGLFGGGPIVPETHQDFLKWLDDELAPKLQDLNVPFLVTEFNVVFNAAGGGTMMRRHYDRYAKHNWAATMWSYKLITSPGRKNTGGWWLITNTGNSKTGAWWIVTNGEPLPAPDFKTADKQRIEDWFREFSTVPYEINEPLRTALLAKEAPGPIEQVTKPKMTEPPAKNEIPGWTAIDINGALPGGQAATADDQVELYASGGDVYGVEDQFRLLYKRMSGDFTLSTSIDYLSFTHTYAKAGIMIRQDLNKDSAFATANVFPDGSVEFGIRPAKRKNVETRIVMGPQLPGVRLKLVRKGNRVERFFACGGGKWDKLDEVTLEDANGDVYAGLFCASHDNENLATAKFKNTSIQTEP